MHTNELIEEAGRQLTICNACRYCEGYCPVFPALEMRRGLTKGDVIYMAHLCHDCRACYYACMYSSPHEFELNVPKILSEVRLESYKGWSWPLLFGRSFTDRRVAASMVTGTIALVAILSFIWIGPATIFSRHVGPGSFYRVIPFFAMLVPALVLVLYSAIVSLQGGARFWRETRDAVKKTTGVTSLALMIKDVVSLRWLRGGGPGCYYPKATPSQLRRVYHSFVFYGFLATVVSTSLAAVYQDLLHRLPPYSINSAPVIFGTVGGLAIIAGVCGLVAMKLKSDPDPSLSAMMSADYKFLIILGLTSFSGMLVLALRNTSAMGLLLIIHLGLVAAFFLTAPYGKFVHSIYRSLALLVHHAEQARARTRSEGA